MPTSRLRADGILGITGGQVTGNQADGGSAGQGLGGGVFRATTAKSTVDAKSKIPGNRASTSGNDLYPA